MARRSLSCGTLLIGPLLVFVVIGGIGLFLISKHAESRLEQTSPTPAPTVVTPASSTTVLFAFANPQKPQDILTALSLPTGSVTNVPVSTGWRSSSIARQGMRVEALADGNTYRLVRSDGWNVVLRSSTGQSYEDPVLVGFFDADHVGVVAHTDTRVLLDVSRFGEVHVLQTLSEESSVRLIQDGAAWITRYTPGEGIESGPQGPSSLIRLTRTGASTTIAESPGLISRVIPFGDRADVFAYATEQGTLTAVSGETGWQGTGTPLVWTNEHQLLFAQGGMLWSRDVTSSTKEQLISFPKLPVIAIVSSTERVLW